MKIYGVEAYKNGYMVSDTIVVYEPEEGSLPSTVEDAVHRVFGPEIDYYILRWCETWTKDKRVGRIEYLQLAEVKA